MTSRRVRHKLDKAGGNGLLRVLVSKPAPLAVELAEVEPLPVAEGGCAQLALGLLCKDPAPGASSLSSRHTGRSPLTSIGIANPKRKLREQPYQTHSTTKRWVG
jgi:hypothetical protein